MGGHGSKSNEREKLLESNSKYGSTGSFNAEDPKDEESTSEFKPVSTFQLYRYATICDKIMVFIGIICALSNGILQPVSSIITGAIVNVLLENNTDVKHDETLLNRALPEIYGFLIVGVAILVVAYLQAALWHTSAERQIHRIRNKFLWAIMRQDIAWYDQNQSGALTTKLTDNIDRMREGMGDKIGICVQSLAQFFAGFGIAFAVSWKMTLVMLTVMPIIMIFVFIFMRIMSQTSKRELAHYAEAGAIAEEVLMNIRTVMSFNAQNTEIKRYEERLKIGRQMGIRKSILTGATLGIFLGFLFSSFGLAFWYGSTLLRSGEIEPGAVFTVFMAVMSGSASIGMVAPQITVFVTAKNAAAAIYAVIDRVPDIDCYSNMGVKPESVEGSIRFHNVSFKYPNRDTKVIDCVSFDVARGETVAFVGHSGCGKSTLFNLLLRYYDTSSGYITLDGENITNLNLEWLRNTTGVVSQEPILFHATIAENLRLGRENITRSEMVEVCKLANAHQFIKELPQGYDTLVGEGGIQLSGGQKQRIAIARALARNPRILLLDEATSALDVESESIVQEALDKASQGRTTLVIAHRLSTVKNFDKIIVMRDGRVVETGTHVQLIAIENGVYRQLVDSQNLSETDPLPKKISKKSIVHRSVSIVAGPTDQHGRQSIFDKADFSSDDSEITAMSKMSKSMLMRRKISRQISRSASKPDEQADRLKEELAAEGVKGARWREIVREAKGEHFLLISAILFSILRGLMMPIFSIVFGQMFRTFSMADLDEMSKSSFRNALFFVALGLIQGTSAFICTSLYGIAGERLTMRLRMSVFRSLLRQEVAYFDDNRHSATKLTTRLATDAPNVKSAIDQRMASIVQGCISLISGLVISFIFGWQMSLVTLVIFVVLLGLQILLNRTVHVRDRRDIRYAEEAGKIAIESIENARTVQALTKQKYLYEQFITAMNKTYKSQLLKAHLQASVYGLASSLSLLISGSAYGFGVYLVTLGYMTPFHVYQVITSLSMSTMGVMNMAAFLPEIMKARLAAGLIFAIIRNEPKIDINSSNGLRNSLRGNVALKDVYFNYPARPDRVILKGLSAGVSPGKTLALVGPSGCGKSTVISLLNRFYDPDDGKIRYDGIDAYAFHLRSLREQLAVVGQEPVLFNCSIRENIAYGCDSCNFELIEKAAKIANIHDTITSMPEGYETRVGERGIQLSGGQKQRIAIARAIVREPTVLLLDEATSALDSESEKVVQKALDAAASGRTCITVAHRLSTIQNADCIAVVRDGRVVECGTHQELVSHMGLYHSMVMKQKLL
uniref:ABC-type xenobiotic transporter n=1 Tax=Parascaris univalens TaxID=6257 RepID=A0A914ZGI6_PARUN